MLHDTLIPHLRWTMFSHFRPCENISGTRGQKNTKKRHSLSVVGRKAHNSPHLQLGSCQGEDVMFVVAGLRFHVVCEGKSGAWLWANLRPDFRQGGDNGTLETRKKI